MTMTQHDVTELSEEISKAAKTVAFQWPGVIDAEDIEQTIYLHLLERPNSIEKLLEEFDERQRLNAIIKIGHQIATQERADYEVFSGNFRYSVNEVKRLLEHRALHNAMDLKNGMAELERKNSKYAEVIVRKYLRGELFAKEDEASRSRLKRALTALTTEMNRSFKQQRDHDGPGSRKPVRASKAHYVTKSHWDDESIEAVNRLMAQARVSGR